MNLRGLYGGVSPPNLENLPFRKAKTVVQCTSAEQLAGPRSIGELLLLRAEKTSQTIEYQIDDVTKIYF